MNETFAALGLLGWKPIIAALLLPPVPWLALVAAAWWQRRRGIGGWLLVLALTGLWLSHCQAVGAWLEQRLVPATALTRPQIAELRQSLAGRRPVVLVLGGGVLPLAPEYGEAHLSDTAASRLHYGVWLARQLQAPLMASGGTGHAQQGDAAEAAVMARIARRDFGLTLRWQEAASRDTRENARLSLRLLRPEGITDLLLVTQGWHMARAQQAFTEEAGRMGWALRIVAAPMGLGQPEMSPALRWLPSVDGYRQVQQALHELIGRLAGA